MSTKKKPTTETTQHDPAPQQLHDPLEEMRKRQKTGGRQPGSQNKVTRMTKEVIANLLNDYQESGLMGSDFCNLDGKDRIVIAEKLMQYVMPKMQNTAVDFNANSGTRITIEQKLREKAQAISKS